jgi:hypothetical protein
MDLLEELDAVQKLKTGRGACSFCTWIDTQDPEEQSRWDRACLPKSGFSASSLLTVAKKHGADVGLSVVKSHRQQGHRS